MINQIKNIIKDRKTLSLVIGLVLISFLTGYWFNSGEEHSGQTMTSSSENSLWTCSMHPQIQQPNPGQCPICGMDLIPVSSGESGQVGERQIKLSEQARKLAGIQVSPVEQKFVSKEINMSGTIEFDETRVKYIAAWVPGRIDRMYVDYTGTPVRKGDHLVELYSPELLSSQQELIQTYKSFQANRSEIMRQNLAAVRERLRLWGLTAEQINSIEKSGVSSDHITIYSPIDGFVVHKNGLTGMYVQTGTKIYTIADLSKLWIQLDAYESDIQWIRYGQKVEFHTQAFPGEKFYGQISFIDPVLNETTRTVRVRVIVDNRSGKLKPGMFVSAAASSQIAAGGKVMDESLAGKWICPMHPEVIKNRAGQCDVCEMDLVRTTDLGYINPQKINSDASLIIPATAPLITGKRAIVYVQVPGMEGVFEGRNIVLGPRAGDYYIVKEGLKKGELVVTNGNFKIDSAIQLLAKPSMINPEPVNIQQPENSVPEPIKKENIAAEFLEQLGQVNQAYFNLQYSLSHDENKKYKTDAADFLENLKKTDMNLLSHPAHEIWMKRSDNLQKYARNIQESKNIEAARALFEKLSREMIKTISQFGTDQSQDIYIYHCPMAFDNKGADWLQNKQGTENPYFGSKMFKCGTEEKTLAQKSK